MSESTPPSRNLERVADVLEALDGLRRARAAAPPAEPPLGTPGIHAEAVRIFSSQERLMRQQATIADGIVRRLRGERADLVQRVVPLRAAAGGVAGGRFVVANEASRAARFTLRPGYALPTTITPVEFTLEAGATRTVELRVDLATAPFSPGETAVLALDVCADGRPRVRVWLDVKLDAAGSAP